MDEIELQTNEIQKALGEEIELDPSKLFAPMSNSVQPISDQSN